MLFVMTYHRIIGQSDALSDFFDVTSGELDRHLRLAIKIWGGGAVPGDLATSKNSSDNERRGFLVTFDDGTSDHYFTAAPVLERLGLRGVFFVSTSLFGAEGYMTLAQCQELQARGHAIESHSHDHKPLKGLSDGELHRQLKESRRIMREQGLGKWNFIAVPGGYFDTRVMQAAGDCGYALLRTIEWGYNRTVNPFRVESITFNRQTAGRWSSPLIHPQFEAAKKALYRTKELAKGGGLRSLYFWLRNMRGG
jgi:peptidoglycan/xylan/chitin deacetylase (PgdA/CDA1 family)